MHFAKKYRLLFFILLFLGITSLLAVFLLGNDIAVLSPKGMIASKERDLIVTTTLLMLIVVVPVFILTFSIAWKYRATNKRAKYNPDWDHNRLIEFSWWAIPSIIIFVLALITWKSTHDLDPFKPLNTGTQPIKVQVVALQWKWLFIYPQENIASVNFVQFPDRTPVNFEITADAPMNSFWVPQLGGQVYAMAGMKTKLHLIADQPGSYNGSSANISGRGFARMRFIAKASSQSDFEDWVRLVKNSPKRLTLDEYSKLARPSENNPATYYSSTEEGLLDTIVMKFLTPTDGRQGGDHHEGSSDYKATSHH